MAKIKIIWENPEINKINLKEWGHDCSWGKLTNEQQNEILDSIRDEFVLELKEIIEL